MICPLCHGRRIRPVVIITVSGELIATEEMPCHECGGQGIVHCCEGDCVQPEPENAVRP